MSVKDTGVVQVQNKPKIVKIYARVTDTELSGIVFEHEDSTRTMFVGPPSAAGSSNVNPMVILDTVCENIPGVTPFGIEYCKSQKNSGAAKTVSTPLGFDRLEWGYYNNPAQYGYSMTDLNFYRNNVLIGTLINNLQRKGSNRKDLVLPYGHVANGLSVQTYVYGDYWPYNVVEAIYGMKDLNAVPVSGGWSDWSPWGSCSTTCGPGTQQRTRTCTNPSPQLGGPDCAGSAIETAPCNKAACPVDGGWTDWGVWGTCSATCGPGTKQRTRTCANPAPANGGATCVGSAVDMADCNQAACPVHGGWSNWSDWGTCSATCGPGTKRRTRTCNNPSPANGGNSCAGTAFDTTPCNVGDCPVDGGWTSWGDWGDCIKNAEGVMEQQQTRTCDNPPPKLGGKPCVGVSTQFRKCVLSQPAAPESKQVTIGPSGAAQAASVPVLDQPSVVASTDKSTGYWKLVLLICIVVLMAMGAYRYALPDTTTIGAWHTDSYDSSVLW